MKTTLDIVSIAKTGVNIVLDASVKTTMDLSLIIREVAATGAHITLQNCNRKTTLDLRSLAMIAPKQITMSFV